MTSLVRILNPGPEKFHEGERRGYTFWFVLLFNSANRHGIWQQKNYTNKILVKEFYPKKVLIEKMADPGSWMADQG